VKSTNHDHDRARGTGWTARDDVTHVHGWTPIGADRCTHIAYCGRVRWWAVGSQAVVWIDACAGGPWRGATDGIPRLGGNHPKAVSVDAEALHSNLLTHARTVAHVRTHGTHTHLAIDLSSRAERSLRRN